MKKLLLNLIFAFIISNQLNAQCTIGAACTPSAQGYCTVPVESTNLPNGTVNIPYSTDIQFTLGTNVGGFATITDATILSVTGMPTGFSYSTNPVSGNFPGGSSACMLVSGTTATAGTYSVVASFSVNTSLMPTTQNLTWILTIDAVSGIKTLNNSNTVFISPNPVSSELLIASTTQIKNIEIIDALGKIILTQEFNYILNTSINTNSLSKGVYFLRLNDGSKIYTKKFIKE